MSSKRTRHDFFYLQIATRYYVNYINLQKETFGKENLDKMNNMKNELLNYKGEELEKKEFEKIAKKIGVKDITLKFFQLRTFGTISAVFSALCLEALINDYCVFKKSAGFLQNYADKLDTVSKWKIFPELFTGKSFPTDGKAFELLKDLYSFRNSLVHPKSKIFEPIENLGDIENTLTQDFLAFIKKANRSYMAIKEATNELHIIDSSFTHLKEYEWLWVGDLSKFKNISDVESFYLSFINDIGFIEKKPFHEH